MAASVFERFVGWCAILNGVAGFLYAVAFFIISRSGPTAGGLLAPLFLMLTGLLSAAVFVALYRRMLETDSAFALLALVLGALGAFGALTHGGYDLANAIHPPAPVPADLPSQVDPRGLLTFGITGAALFVFARLMLVSGQFPRGLSYLGYLSAILLVVLYLGRLIILDPTHPVIVVPAVLNGFLVGPAWYVWLGIVVWRGPTASDT